MTTYTTSANSALSGWRNVAEFFTHFLGIPNELDLTKTNASAALTIADAAGGGYGRLTTGSTTPADNNGVFLATQGEIFKFDSQHGFALRSQLKFTPSGGNTDNVLAIGVQNAPTEDNFLADDGAGPRADYWGAGIYKIDGGTTWICEVSAGTTQQTLDTGIAADGSETTFEIEYLPSGGDAAYGQVVFRIGGEIVRRPGTFAREVFAPEISLSGATEMKAIVGHKTGAASELIVDINAIGWALGLSS
ncbi:hypothetical protein C5Y96_10755 [Blastopirellula marina]|uniref:Uncharacterized protein n=1 Tax=Blastopirellula marina TaxID=124 RepID=A0A2S8FM93_9BACT|nr:MULTISPECIES: hypothetical protein [Pirellulaceae]PQO33323.1 hypothetical protein C5Y96_10755 [Blastopirellula marina]RCS52412.1 hypothetical protein DTL36_10765 [Bremerella cremea]